VEDIEEPLKTEEMATRVEEDEFDWANATAEKKGQVVSVAQTPSVPYTPDPENADHGTGAGGGAGGGKKKKGKGKRG